MSTAPFSVRAEINFDPQLNLPKLTVLMFSETTMAELMIELRKRTKISAWTSMYLLINDVIVLPSNRFEDVIKLMPAPVSESTDVVNPLPNPYNPQNYTTPNVDTSMTIKIECRLENTFGNSVQNLYH